ncbi:MAG: Gfo/Idh/MocA family oxidoreductase [Nanoarchaeota archaeon]
MSLNIGVIGCGYWGPNIIRNFNQIDSTNLYYICDLDQKKMEHIKKSYPSVKTTTDYKDILKDPKIDAVAIAVPVAYHYSIAKDALLSGKHVLVEKPLANSVKEVEELINITKEKNLILMVDHTFEYAEAVNKIKEIYESGELGDIYYMRADWFNLGLLQPDVNVILDLVTHVISIISYVTGLKPVSLTANGSAYLRKDILEIAHLKIKYPKNITAYVTASWLEPRKTRGLTIVGSKKLLVYDQINLEEQVKIYDKGVDVTKQQDDVSQIKINYRYGDIYAPNIKNIEPLKIMCSHFADCIIHKKKPRSDGESGLNIMKVFEAAEESLKNNGKEASLK